MDYKLSRLLEFLKDLLYGLIVIIGLFVVSMIISWALSWDKIPVDIAIVCRMLASYALLCGALCAITFITKSAHDFYKSLRSPQDKSSN